MTNEPDQTAGEGDGVVQEAASAVEAPTAKPRKKVATKAKRKKPTAKSKRRKTAAKPVAPPPPLTLDELKEQGVQAKREIVSAVIEPAVEVVGSLSQTIRDTIGGAFAGLLSRKKRY